MISRWPDSDRTRIGSYVASLDLRDLKAAPAINRSCIASRMPLNGTGCSINKRCKLGYGN